MKPPPRALLLLALALSALSAPAALLPSSLRQLVVGLAPDWNAPRAQLMAFQRASPSSPWLPAWKSPHPAMLGQRGLAWGNGALPVPHGQPGIPSKREKDQRAPAGLFRIGTLYSENPQSLPNLRLPSYRISARDCWIDDPALPS